VKSKAVRANDAAESSALKRLAADAILKHAHEGQRVPLAQKSNTGNSAGRASASKKFP
jgi:hypothetical protein